MTFLHEEARPSTPELPLLTLYEIVGNVFDAERRKAQTVEAQRHLLQCRIERDSRIPGLERDVWNLRRKLEQMG